MRLIFLTVVLTVLTGCVTPGIDQPPITDESHEAWYQRQQQLSSFSEWSIRGRVALYLDDEVYNLGLGWVRNQGNSKIKLEASLGQGVVLLEKTNSSVKLTTSEGENYTGKNAEQVLLQSTGWSIPIEGLEYWILGINHPESDYLPEIDFAGRANSLRQNNWNINYLEYSTTDLDQYNNPELPRKMYMKRYNLALKIVVDQWQADQNLTASELFPAFPD